MAIPFQLVTGFLGSGKTTFLRKYLGRFSGEKKIAVIQNEFAPVNVDSQELKGENGNYEILEINNGSVFCVCLLGDFIESLSKFIDEQQPDEVLLEASGMSDPMSIGQIFQSKLLKEKVYLDYIWCLVDARNFKKIAGLQTRVKHQVRMADSVVLNKIDLAEESIEVLVKSVKEINPFAQILPATFSDIAFKKAHVPFKFYPEGEHEVIKPELESLVIKTNKPISEENLERFINEIKSSFLRCKGYINLRNNKKIFVQGVLDHYELTTVEYFDAPTEIVAIGEFDEANSFINLFDKYCLND